MSRPTSFLTAFASRLRFPQLFFLAAGLFALDMLVPDAIPFIDEALLGLLTLLLGAFKDRRTPEDHPVTKNVTPPHDP